MSLRTALVLVAMVAAGAFAASVTAAATVTVSYIDPNDGFHSVDPPDPASPASGATLGEQRKSSFQAAADNWGARLTSNVTIVVEARMIPLSCNGFSATLGAAGPTFVNADWTPGGGGSLPPLASTWYHAALADKIANTDLDNAADVGATFNSNIDDNDGCLNGINWFYAEGPDPAPPSTIAFFPVVLHEIGHGIGVSTFVNSSSGNRFMGMNDVYMTFLEDHSLGLTWDNMTNSERQASAIDDGDLHWIGPAVQASIGVLTSGVQDGHVRMFAPNPLQTGSSVSHWDVALEAGSSDELMEPFATGTEEVLLTDEMLEDEGWGPVIGSFLCGNGTIESNEECDDGGMTGGDGCSSSCLVEECYSCDMMEPTNCTPLTGPPCDDGMQCTTDICQVGVCVSTPETGTPCDDGFVCTTDLCNSGVCEGDTSSCELDHFKMYKAKTRKGTTKFGGENVSLADQFETKQTDVSKPALLGNPANKNGEGVSVPEAHLECYKIKDDKSIVQAKFEKRTVEVDNQFGIEKLDVIKPSTLCVPSAKDESTVPQPLQTAVVDHFKCYKSKTAKGEPKFQPLVVGVEDQFETKQTLVQKPAEVCNPVDKNGEGIIDMSGHLVCYKIKDDKSVPQAKFAPTNVFTANQFGQEALTAQKPARLCVPSTKTEL